MSSDQMFTSLAFDMKVGHRQIAVPRLDIVPGQVVGIAGRNGAGKTVLLRHWMGWIDKSPMQKMGLWLDTNLSMGWLNTKR